jgi:hypothetical protein
VCVREREHARAREREHRQTDSKEDREAKKRKNANNSLPATNAHEHANHTNRSTNTSHLSTLPTHSVPSLHPFYTLRTRTHTHTNTHTHDMHPCIHTCIYSFNCCSPFTHTNLARASTNLFFVCTEVGVFFCSVLLNMQVAGGRPPRSCMQKVIIYIFIMYIFIIYNIV